MTCRFHRAEPARFLRIVPVYRDPERNVYTVCAVCHDALVAEKALKPEPWQPPTQDEAA